ncbi:PPR repeat family protein [Nitzschia inconspicua]|uniref:PPR repeat family protein n=1 Tax=Nitzschia inconspicua TaxID=303405 RepID=A0A9K3PCL9_9STRA|nr:PPR repeat family protein [Nitzschia inconspicua]
MWRAAGQRLLVRRRPSLPMWGPPMKDWTPNYPLNPNRTGAMMSTKVSAPKITRRLSPKIHGNSQRKETRGCFDFDAVEGIRKRLRELLGNLPAATSSCAAERTTKIAKRDVEEVIQIWSGLKLSRHMQDEMLTLVDKLLVEALQQGLHDADNNIISSETISSLIIAWSRSKIPDAAERAEHWLREMIRLAEMYPDRGMAPRPNLFSPVISAWEKRSLSDPEKATRHGKALWEQLEGLIAAGNHVLHIYSSTYYMYLSLWAKSGLPEAPMQAESVLRNMIQAGKTNPKVIPSCQAFVNVISAWEKSGSVEAPLRAYDVLELIRQEYQRRRETPTKWAKLEINDAPFNATIQSWVTAAANDDRGVSLTQAENNINRILAMMKALKIRSSPVTVWNILPLYHNDGIDHRPQKLLQLLDHGRGNAESRHNMILNLSFLKAIELCCEESRRSQYSSAAAEVAEEILLVRYLKLPRRQRRLEPNMQAFVTVLKAWKYQLANENLPVGFAQKRLEAVLKRMVEECDRIIEHKGNPLVYSFLARAWAVKSTSLEALNQVEENIVRLLDFYKGSTEFALRPSWLHDTVISVKESFPEQQSSHFCERLYRKLTDDSQQFLRLISSVSPQDAKFDHRDQEFLDSILAFLANNPSSQSGKRAEMVLLTMQDMQEKGNFPPLTFESFKKVLLCWSKSSETGAAKRAEDILSLAEELHRAGDKAMKPDFDSYLAVINAWSKSCSPDAPEKIKNRLVGIKRRRAEGDRTFEMKDEIYASLILAYGNSGCDQSCSMAQAVFNTTPEKMRTTAVYNALIEAQGGDANKAEAILQDMHYLYTFEKMESVKPETETFNAVIQAWVRSGNPMAAWRADGIFKRMKDLTENGHLDVYPNSKTFDLVISALAQGQDVEMKIDAYLSLLRQHYASGKLDCSPTITSYTEALKVWCAKENNPHAFLRAKALLDEMHELAREGLTGVRPNRLTYEVYLKALSRSSVDARAELAKDVVKKMKEDSVEVKGDMRRLLQRCFLPTNSHESSFVLNNEDIMSC